MISLVQKNRRPLIVINRMLEKLRIERQYLERKICSRVGIVMTDVAVPPIVSAAIADKPIENESLLAKAILLQQRNCSVNGLSWS